jgi:hypothetical protein
MSDPPRWTQESVLAVPGGRGFLVEAPCGVVVITAAHCLPHLPSAHPASYIEERTYAAFLGPLGAKPTVWAECRFVDPIADIAVLSEPDAQELSDENDAYHRLTDDRPTLPIGKATREPTPAWLFTLSGQWVTCTVKLSRFGNALSLDGATKEATWPGTSGSPIISSDGRALGIISCGEANQLALNPTLAGCLPPWLLLDSIYGGVSIESPQ